MKIVIRLMHGARAILTVYMVAKKIPNRMKRIEHKIYIQSIDGTTNRKELNMLNWNWNHAQNQEEHIFLTT